MLFTDTNEPTPCGVLFDTFKRAGGITHRELATLVLSERPLSDGRSPVSRASDRTWISHAIVHAPVGSLQPRYFRDFGFAAQCVMGRLRASRRRGMTSGEILHLVCGEPSRLMEAALGACQQDVRLYRNTMERLRTSEGYTVGERAEAAMVLFVACGCSANVRAAVDYTLGYVRDVLGGRLGTPESAAVEAGAGAPAFEAPARPLGLLRVEGGYVAAAPYWVDPAGDPVEIGTLATGAHDITDVAEDVSACHLRVWHAPDGRWLVRDLGSTNGTVLVSADAPEPVALEPEADVQVHPGDELRLGASTVFMLIEGMPEVL